MSSKRLTTMSGIIAILSICIAGCGRAEKDRILQLEKENEGLKKELIEEKNKYEQLKAQKVNDMSRKKKALQRIALLTPSATRYSTEEAVFQFAGAIPAIDELIKDVAMDDPVVASFQSLKGALNQIVKEANSAAIELADLEEKASSAMDALKVESANRSFVLRRLRNLELSNGTISHARPELIRNLLSQIGSSASAIKFSNSGQAARRSRLLSQVAALTERVNNAEQSEREQLFDFGRSVFERSNAIWAEQSTNVAKVAEEIRSTKRQSHQRLEAFGVKLRAFDSSIRDSVTRLESGLSQFVGN